METCKGGDCKGKRISTFLDAQSFCIPRSLKVSRTTGEHGDIHYLIVKSGRKEITLTIVSGPYFPASNPRETDPTWAENSWECDGIRGFNYTRIKSKNKSRYVTLAPNGYATYANAPDEIAALFDKVLDSMCCK